MTEKMIENEIVSLDSYRTLYIEEAKLEEVRELFKYSSNIPPRDVKYWVEKSDFEGEYEVWYR